MTSSKEGKARIGRAFRAMKGIGISEAKVKPVLKNLLKVYEKNWELIEAENYRVLADAIFEREEAEAIELSKKAADNEAAVQSKKIVNSKKGLEDQAEEGEESVRPLKRLRRGNQDGQSSSPAATASDQTMHLIRPKDEPTELPNTCAPEISASQDMVGSPHPSAENTRTDPQLLSKNKGKQPISPESLAAPEVCEPCQPNSVRSPTHAMKLRDRGKQPVSPKTLTGEKGSPPHSTPKATATREWKIVRGTVPAPRQKRISNFPLVIPKDEPFTDDMPQIALPLDILCPGPLIEDSSDQNGTIRKLSCLEPDQNATVRELSCLDPPASPSMNEKERIDGTDTPNETRRNGDLEMTSGQCASNLEIASSPSGEVKITLSCNLALERPDVHMPSLDAVLQLVEGKCFGSYRTLDPNFSVMNIMKEICQCFLSLRSGHSEGPTTVVVHPTPNIDLLSKSSTTDDLSAGGLQLSTITEAHEHLSNAELPLAIIPLVTYCNGTDDGCPLEESNGGDDHGSNIENKELHAEETNGLSLVVFNQPVASEIIRPLPDVLDITKGRENVPISLVNEVNSESPPSFYYMPQNVVFQNASVNFSFTPIGDKDCSACSGNCLLSAATCTCAHSAGGEFAYTPDGLVHEGLLQDCISIKRDLKKHNHYFCKECPWERSKSGDITEPCKGHLLRKFIKECWLRCGCDKQCGNRVVQRGITCNLQVFMTPEGKGWGLRALENMPQGAFVCEFVGEVITNSEFFGRIVRSTKREKYSHPVVLDADWGAEKAVVKDEEALCLDATNYGNVAKFINHRCYDANLVEIPVKVETSDRHYYRFAFFTARNIEAMEELTWDYGIDFDDHDHPIKAFHCQCGSKFCRNIRRSRTRTSISRI